MKTVLTNRRPLISILGATLILSIVVSTTVTRRSSAQGGTKQQCGGLNRVYNDPGCYFCPSNPNPLNGIGCDYPVMPGWHVATCDPVINPSSTCTETAHSCGIARYCGDPTNLNNCSQINVCM